MVNRQVDPKTNVPTVAALAVAFVTKLLDWATMVLPESVPDGVVESGYVLVVALAAVAIGKVAQGFTWAQDSVDKIMDADRIIAAAERGEHTSG